MVSGINLVIIGDRVSIILYGRNGFYGDIAREC